MYNINQFQGKQNKDYGFAIIMFLIICFASTTLAFFFYAEYSNKALTTSGPVLIEAVGAGDVTIEDTRNTTKLEVFLDDKYDVLIPGMPIDLTANCKVYKSTTKPLLRAMIELDLVDMTTGEDFDEDSTLETTRLMIAQNMLNQLNSQAEENGWYLHSDSYYYYVAINVDNLVSGGGYTNI